MVKVGKNDDPYYINYNFGYNVCPLACKICLTGPFFYGSEVVSRQVFSIAIIRNMNQKCAYILWVTLDSNFSHPN